MVDKSLVEEVKRMIDEDIKIPAAIRDRFLVTATLSVLNIVDVLQAKVNTMAPLTDMQKIEKRVSVMEPWVRGLKWFALVIGGAIVLMLFGMLTHTFKWPF